MIVRTSYIPESKKDEANIFPKEEKKTSILDMFKKKCPKCNSTNLKVEKESLLGAIKRFTLYVAFFITILFVRAPKPLYVCRDCGFSWEKR